MNTKDALTEMPDGDIFWLCPTCDYGDCVGTPKCYTVDYIAKLQAAVDYWRLRAGPRPR